MSDLRFTQLFDFALDKVEEAYDLINELLPINVINDLKNEPYKNEKIICEQKKKVKMLICKLNEAKILIDRSSFKLKETYL